jgi:hypothetical protein
VHYSTPRFFPFLIRLAGHVNLFTTREQDGRYSRLDTRLWPSTMRTLEGNSAMQNIARSFLAGVITLLGASGASALEAQFNRPTYKSQGLVRLDNCEHFGSSCGSPAADHYCRIQGYESASNFETVRATPTKVIFGRQCNGPGCVAFKFIVCFTSAPQRGARRDWPPILDNNQ